jgi:hypothetical protein
MATTAAPDATAFRILCGRRGMHKAYAEMRTFLPDLERPDDTEQFSAGQGRRPVPARGGYVLGPHADWLEDTRVYSAIANVMAACD